MLQKGTLKVDKFIFDVDGTLTPSRGLIDPQFKEFMLEFSAHNDVYLVTGSDHPKTVEQIGADLAMSVQRIYNCSGSDVWEQEKNIYTNEWKIPDEAEAWLREELELSKFPLRTGLHIEDRPGMCNFSVVGRNATLGERKLYVEWDEKMEERDTIARLFKQNFPGIEAVVGGETGIDIYPVGADKSQILRDFDIDNDFIYFFGDKMSYGGNDFPLKIQFVRDKWSGKTVEVQGWEDTWSNLNAYLSNGT